VKVLLTGATGFVGSHVARALVRLGHDVHAVIRPTSDRRRIADLERALTIHPGQMDDVPIAPDLAIHLAWYTVPGRYLTAPENRECLEASRRLLNRLDCRAVCVGTCFEFDPAPGVLRGDSPTRPATLYAECKDTLRREVVRREDSAWIRLFYQYGPWEDTRRLVPQIILGMLRGTPVSLTHGAQRRDFLHIEDVASAICAVATSGVTGPVNVGSGAAPSVRDIAMTIATQVGRADLLRFGAIPSNAGEPPLIVADNARLRSTGWSPRYDLEEGLAQTLEWWRRRPC